MVALTLPSLTQTLTLTLSQTLTSSLTLTSSQTSSITNTKIVTNTYEHHSSLFTKTKHGIKRRHNNKGFSFLHTGERMAGCGGRWAAYGVMPEKKTALLLAAENARQPRQDITRQDGEGQRTETKTKRQRQRQRDKDKETKTKN